MDRRDKYSQKYIKNTNLKIDVQFDITELDIICLYIVSENKSIRRGNIINLRNLFGIMNMENYAGDQTRLERISFIEKGIEARITYNLINSDLILKHINGGFGSINDFNMRQLSNAEVDYVNKTISEILKYSIIYNDVDDGLAILTKFKATDYINRGAVVKEFEEWINKIQVKFRRAKALDVDDITFSLTGESFAEAMYSTYDQTTSPSNKLLFGTQGLNALTGGGVQAQRVYTLLGLPGEGKSSTLLDMAIQIKRYNKNYQCKDPTKRPCVVVLIMENSIQETVERIFSMCVGNSMTNYSKDEILDILNTQGNLQVSNEDPIDLIIKFRPNLSEDTSYLYTFTEDLEDEGYEVICMIQDYIKRIRSVEGSFGGDLRMQLGAVINEFKVFATLKNIPVITASQLNRTATQNIDEARIKNKADLVRLIGRSNVGESNLIIENSDWIALIAPEYDKDGTKYLGIQRVKSRYYIAGDIYTAYIPYIKDSIKFIEDYYSPVPVHKVTMKEEVALNTGASNNGIVNEIKTINDIKLLADDNNIFANANFVANMQVRQPLCKVILCKYIDE